MQGDTGVQRVSELEQTEEGGPVRGWNIEHGRYHRVLIKSVNTLLMEARFLIVRKTEIQKEKARITPGVGFQLRRHLCECMYVYIHSSSHP